MNRTTSNGFSLIELLVVMAIIGILATVTYTSLSGARDKAKDKTIAASMQSMLIEANLYHSKHDSYLNFCTDTTTQMNELLAKITTDAPSAPTCQDDATKFGVIVTLHSGSNYCVDSSKSFGEVTVPALNGKQCH